MKHQHSLTTVALYTLLTGCQSAPWSSSPALYTLMTDQDIRQADTTLQHTLESIPSSSSAAWHNHTSGNSGSVWPLRSYKSLSGYYCRDYKEELRIGNQRAAYFDTACRNEAGKWYPI